MKSTDKFMLVLVASLFLLIAGCGGGGSSSPSPDPEPMAMPDPDPDPAPAGPTPAEIDGLTKAIADPDGDGKIPESEDNELTKRRPGESIYLMAGGKIAVGGSDFDGGDELGENDTNIPNSEEFQEISESRIDLSGFATTSVHQRTKSKKTDTLTIYSNVGAAESTPFNDFTWPTGLTAGTEGDTQPTGGERMVYDVVTLSGAVASKYADKLSGSKIPPSAGTNRTTEAGDTFAGTLYGIPGKYGCATSNCVLTRDDDGILTASGGAFTFTANPTNIDTEDTHVIAGAKPDPDYLVLGYWLQESANDKYGVGVFVEGSLPFDYDTTAIAGLDGTATYDGSATGMYAKKDLEVQDGTVVGTPAETGQFSADVSLTAHFGNDADPAVNGSDKISAAEDFTISGTVDNFQNAAGVINSNWMLKLNAASISALTNTNRMFIGTTGEGSSMGQWDGAFYGSPVNTGTGNMATEDDYPSSVAGRFTGHFSDGHVIGAFGATTE